jgi:predicted aldo/keto reductase-like oxidoreductase
MQYRTFPKIPDLKISTLGFGCMRLPVVNGEAARIDEPQATALIHQAIESGVNYLDTAWPYHANQSEPFVGRALKGEWRSKVQLATKHPVWMVNTEADWEKYLDLQLQRLATDRIDFYLLHALAAERWEALQRFKGFAAMERAKKDGRIGHLGFSFHGPLDVFKKICDGYDWEFCQIQYNFLDEGFQAGTEGLNYAAARRIGVVVMEPLRGGALAKAPEPVQRLWARSTRGWSPAEWALRWLYAHEDVVTVLSGMNSQSQLVENLRVAGEATVGGLGADDLELVEAVKKIYQAKTRVPCTTCGYCLPCPNEVSIPDILNLFNAAAMFESKQNPRFVYQHYFLGDGAGADQCTKCGECLPKCPQSIAIPDRLEEAHAFLMSP